MKLTEKDKRLLELIDFITDRFYGSRILPQMVINAIKDFQRDNNLHGIKK